MQAEAQRERRGLWGLAPEAARLWAGGTPGGRL